jgi:ABC-type Na+ efflux pump permease subunit
MDYAKRILCGFTAIVLAELVPGSWSVFRGMSGTKATGLAVVAGGFLESLLSPLFWIVAIAIFALFFAASRLGNKPLRIFLFWIPTLTVCSISVATVVLLTYLIIRSRNP